MRANRLLAAAALLLAGCGTEEKLAGDEAKEVANEAAAAPASVAPPPAAPAAAPAPVTPPAKGDSIPVVFHGVYDSSIEACGQPGDGRLTVSAGELRFYESVGSVRSAVSEPSGVLRVEADYQGEGQSWRSRRELLLSGDGAKLTVSGDGTRMVRVRCPRAL